MVFASSTIKLLGFGISVLSELVSSHIQLDVNKMKGETELNNKYTVCEELGR